MAANDPKARVMINQSWGFGGVILFNDLNWFRILNINAKGRRVGEHRVPVSQTQEFEFALMTKVGSLAGQLIGGHLIEVQLIGVN